MVFLHKISTNSRSLTRNLPLLVPSASGLLLFALTTRFTNSLNLLKMKPKRLRTPLILSLLSLSSYVKRSLELWPRFRTLRTNLPLLKPKRLMLRPELLL